MNPYQLLPRKFGHGDSPAATAIDVSISVLALHAADRLEDLYRRLSRGWRRAHRRRAAIRQLRELDDATLADIGLPRGQIRAVVNDMLDAEETDRLASGRVCDSPGWASYRPRRQLGWTS